MDRYMIDVELAAELGLAVKTLRKWRSEGAGPPFVRMGGAVRYRLPDVEAWIAANTVTPGGAA